jgi:hypothetical protein
LAKTIGKYPIGEHQKYLTLVVLVEDEDGNDPDVPSVVIKLKK